MSSPRCRHHGQLGFALEIKINVPVGLTEEISANHLTEGTGRHVRARRGDGFHGFEDLRSDKDSTCNNWYIADKAMKNLHRVVVV